MSSGQYRVCVVRLGASLGGGGGGAVPPDLFDRPDITSVVDRALKITYLSIHLFGFGGERLFEVSAVTPQNRL